jgi:hypothetical protein
VIVRRQINLLVAAPGREDEAVQALTAWLSRAQEFPGFRGGAVLREYAGEFKDMPNVLALTYDLDSREVATAFADWVKTIPDPTRPDLPGPVPADQIGVLVSTVTQHSHGHDHDHDHTHDHRPVGPGLEFNRGGGLFARLLHMHSEIVTDTSRQAVAVGSDGA